MRLRCDELQAGDARTRVDFISQEQDRAVAEDQQTFSSRLRSHELHII